MWCEKDIPVIKFNSKPDEDDGLDYFCQECRVYVDEYKRSLDLKYKGMKTNLLHKKRW